MRFSHLIPLLFLAVLCGCVTSENREQLLTVNFPEVKLDKDEYIEHVQLHITFAKVATVNHVRDDWDFTMSHDDPSEQSVDLQARHFVSGLPDVRALNGLVTMIVDETNLPYLNVSAVLTTQKTEPAGSGERTIDLSKEQMILKPAGH